MTRLQYIHIFPRTEPPNYFVSVLTENLKDSERKRENSSENHLSTVTATLYFHIETEFSDDQNLGTSLKDTLASWYSICDSELYL